MELSDEKVKVKVKFLRDCIFFLQATSAPSVNGREPDATDRETEPNIEATDAAGDGIEKVPSTGRTSVTKIKGPKKKTSHVWKHFTEVLIEEKVDDMVVLKRTAECNYCQEVLSAESKQGTTRLWNHYHAFHDKNKGKPNITKLKGADWKYDEETSMRKYYLAIIMHEYPFSFCEHEYTNDFNRSLCPIFPIRCRKTARGRIMAIFYDEKKKLFDYLASYKCRFSCTMDGWTSNQNKGYLCVTCHFIDDDWKL